MLVYSCHAIYIIIGACMLSTAIQRHNYIYIYINYTKTYIILGYTRCCTFDILLAPIPDEAARRPIKRHLQPVNKLEKSLSLFNAH